MNRQLNHRFAAALASVAITFSLVSGVAGLAKPSTGVDAQLLAQSSVTVAMR